MKLAAALFLLLLVPAASAAEDGLGTNANSTFLAANAQKPGAVTRPSGLQYRILRSGTGRRPAGNDVIRLAYGIRLINGTLVDSTTPVLPATLAMHSVSLAGLAEALSLMHAGDHWQLVIPANLAFGGSSAMGGAIPPNQTLLMDLTLVSVAPPGAGQTMSENPFSVWSNGRENGAALTIRP
jgi:FKBP-type peptidyl-prolyl cis-trans isomerase FklB